MTAELDYQATRAFTRPELFLVPASLAAPEPVDEGRARELALADALDERGRMNAVRGEPKAARVLHEQAMELRRKHYGERDPWLPRSFTWLGELFLREQRVEEACWALEQAHRLACNRFSPVDLRVATALHNLAVVARRRGDLEKASELGEEALSLKVEQLGWDDPSVAMTLCLLAGVARRMRELAVALTYYDRARAIYEKTIGGVNAGLAVALIGLAQVHLDYGVAVSARFLVERALQIHEAIELSPAQVAAAQALLSRANAEEVAADCEYGHQDGAGAVTLVHRLAENHERRALRVAS